MKALGNPMPEPVVKVDEEAKDTGAKANDGDGPDVPKDRAIKNLSKRSNPKVDNDTPIETPEEQLNALTARPRAEDTILFCLPVSAPYSTMSKYKYRVKLTPGSQRRGRSCKAVVQHFLQNVKEGTTKREKELIRSMSDAEAIAAMLSDVQINTSAAEKMSKKLQGSSKHSKGKKKTKGGKKKKR